MAKLKTLSEAETARRRAVTGLRNLGRDDEADRYDSMDAREYAEAKGIELVENPKRRRANMPQRQTVGDLQDQLNDANDYIADLEDRLDSIAGIVGANGDDDNGDENDLDDTDDSEMDDNGDDQD